MTRPKQIIFDVDGVMTTGHFLYTEGGKVMKIFGAHDSDGLHMLKKHFDIQFVSGDKRGFEITKARCQTDLGFPTYCISAEERLDYINTHYGAENVIYMGDGIYDVDIIKAAALGITPANARRECLAVADYITPSNSAEGAVLDAALYILKHYGL